MKHWPFRVVNENTKPKISVDYKGETKTFFPEEISSMVLTKMKETAEAFIGKVYQFAHGAFFKISVPLPIRWQKAPDGMWMYICLQGGVGVDLISALC